MTAVARAPGVVLALDFVNTSPDRSDRGEDPLASPDGFLKWMDGLPLHPPALHSLPELRILLSEARTLRSAIDHLLTTHSNGLEPSPRAVFEANRILDAATVAHRMVISGQEVAIEQRVLAVRSRGQLMPLVLGASQLLTDVDRSRLRACAAVDCNAWFIDTSKGGRRRWCSMARCGNRAKAARFRQRQASEE